VYSQRVGRKICEQNYPDWVRYFGSFYRSVCYIYIQANMHKCTHVCMHAYIRMYLTAYYAHTPIHVHTHTHTHTHTYVFMYESIHIPKCCIRA